MLHQSLQISFSISCVHAKSLQLYLTLCDTMGCILPGFSVHGVLKARILEWFALFSTRGPSNGRLPLRGIAHKLHISDVRSTQFLEITGVGTRLGESPGLVASWDPSLLTFLVLAVITVTSSGALRTWCQKLQGLPVPGGS